MMKFIVLILFASIIGENLALDIENYTAYIDELSRDEKFLTEYAKWSFSLFSQPDYLYGTPPKEFTCKILKSPTVPTSVHALQPGDIKCVGAIGDSLTAGLGAHAITPIGLLFENRGVAWSVGGDHTFTKLLSVPNALREYNSQLEGFSTKVSVAFLNGQNAKNNHLNVAKSGDRSNHMSGQADLLMNRLKKEGLCNWDSDWKMITFFVGGNDLCNFCNDPGHTPEEYLANVRDTLDKLYNAPIPRTLVNLVLVLNMSFVQDLNSGGFICQILHKRTCPCAAFPTPEQKITLIDYIHQYQQVLTGLVDSGRYYGREDFTVVIQPFFVNTQLPRKKDNTIDFSYFSPDCFHFSGKGHSQAALSLWNNMFEPVGAKKQAWHMGEPLECPTDDHPYIFTVKNSAKALEEYKRATMASTTDPTTSIASSSVPPTASSTEKHKHKHHKSDSDEFNKMRFAVYAGFFLLLMILLIVVITRRQQIRVLVHGAGRRHLNGFTNPQYPDDDDVEVWNKISHPKSGLSVNSDVPKTHGTRITFE